MMHCTTPRPDQATRVPSETMNPAELKRAFLYVFLGMIVLTGLLAAYAILNNDSWQWSARIIGSCVTTGTAAIMAMGCAAVWERKKAHPLGLVSIVMVVTAAVFTIALIWLFDNTVGDMVVKYVAAFDVIAFTLAHITMLLLARLRREFEVGRVLTMGAAGGCGLLCTMMILTEESRGLWQLATLAGIGSATGTLAVVILHLISRVCGVGDGGEALPTTTPTTARRIVRLDCPRCGLSREAPLGRSLCSCGLGITVTVEEETCTKCGYLLYGLTTPTCPECGTPRAGAAKQPPPPDAHPQQR